MKTITLTEEAYERLNAWKESQKDSFSKVVDRVVSARGSLKSVRAAWEELPPLSAKQMEAMEKGLSELRDWSKQRDPWTT